MLGLSFEKLIVVAMIAVFVLGPDRLPLYAGKLAALVQSLRGRTDAAKARVKQELGDDFDIAEWKQLDPRQYDPRRIIREALAEQPAPMTQPEPQPRQEPQPQPQPESSIARLMRTSLSRAAETAERTVERPAAASAADAVPLPESAGSVEVVAVGEVSLVR
ncbi:hypothetical protein [Cryobacterium arcticum]|uniref:Putative twin arginine-targeting protein translocase TatB n=1 Tax=Cryobacterium arcticum TaxID=670052 RepID=A0A1B1BPG0_9MICO|nr:hypothetical protein [Cryobacterium arcticum]ANP74391.1 Putative twin arginine-targeting protein translocase TatB [Cryobacterium arcticum]